MSAREHPVYPTITRDWGWLCDSQRSATARFTSSRAARSGRKELLGLSFLPMWITTQSGEMPSLTANSTNLKSGFCTTTSRPTRNAPRSEPVPPMAALISENDAAGNRRLSQSSDPTRQPDAAVMLPPR